MKKNMLLNKFETEVRTNHRVKVGSMWLPEGSDVLSTGQPSYPAAEHDKLMRMLEKLEQINRSL